MSTRSVHPAPPPYALEDGAVATTSPMLRLPQALILRILEYLALSDLIPPLWSCRRLRSIAGHILLRRTRSHFASGVRPPCTSATDTGERERLVAILFGIALGHDQRREEESELYADQVDRSAWHRDIFDLHQPRARLEDLLMTRLDLDLTVELTCRRAVVLAKGRRPIETHRVVGEALEAIADRLNEACRRGGRT